MSTTASYPGRTEIRRVDIAHHHPQVFRQQAGWAWSCSCGGASRRGTGLPTWHQALVYALGHSVAIAA